MDINNPAACDNIDMYNIVVLGIFATKGNKNRYDNNNNYANNEYSVVGLKLRKSMLTHVLYAKCMIQLHSHQTAIDSVNEGDVASNFYRAKCVSHRCFCVVFRIVIINWRSVIIIIIIMNNNINKYNEPLKR